MAKCGFALGIVATVLQVLLLVLYFSLIGFILVAGSQLDNQDELGYPEEIADYLDVGSSMTYTLGDVDYEVTPEKVSSAGAVLNINGEQTPWLSVNKEYALSDGTLVKVDDIETYEDIDTVYFTLSSE